MLAGPPSTVTSPVTKPAPPKARGADLPAALRSPSGTPAHERPEPTARRETSGNAGSVGRRGKVYVARLPPGFGDRQGTALCFSDFISDHHMPAWSTRGLSDWTSLGPHLFRCQKRERRRQNENPGPASCC